MKKILIPLAFSWLEVFTCQALIVYTDVNPDATVNNAAYNLDLDNNGTTDFSLTALGNVTVGWVSCDASAGSLNYVLIDSQNGQYVVSNSSNGNIGASSAYWHQTDSTNVLLYATGLGGSGGWFTNSYDGYVGFKFYIGASYHYGWARVAVNTSNMSFTIKDYAYETVANTAIAAGATPNGFVGIDNEATELASTIKVTNNNQLKKVTVLTDKNISEINIYDVSGRRIKEIKSIEAKESIIDTYGILSGTYIVQVVTNERVENKKIFIVQ